MPATFTKSQLDDDTISHSPISSTSVCRAKQADLLLLRSDTVVIQAPWNSEAGRHHEIHEVPRRAFPTGTHTLHAQYKYTMQYTLFLQMEHFGFVQIRTPLEPPSQLGDRRLQVAPVGRMLLRQSSIALALAGSQSAIRRQSPQTLLPMEQLAARRLDMEPAARGLTCLAPVDDGDDGSSSPPKPLPNRAWCIYGSRKHGGSASQSTSRLGRAPLTKAVGRSTQFVCKRRAPSCDSLSMFWISRERAVKSSIILWLTS